MFVSRGLSASHAGHRCTSSAKFINTRRISHEEEQVPDIEDEAHPTRSLICAFVSSIFCPILGCIALFYGIRAVRAHNQGFYAEANTFNKQTIRWSLITFIIGLTIGSIIGFIFFVKAVVFI
ncbi:unnamed protein product [Adineta steineri]|uniref:Uncharacterized protein n=1 Tax=Adineta steineri TaxID=433720 RepID=A0A818XAA3_9BILA|nr:unnamed protein product [Adineta steineri]CAF3737509.1 unnamed protein product [Adineta steineri]